MLKIMSHCAVLSHSVISDSLQPHGLQTARLLCPCRFSRQEYWNGFPCLLQGIFPTQGSNPVLPHCRQFFYLLSHQVSPMSHQGNANQNHNEIPLHTHQDGKESKSCSAVSDSLRPHGILQARILEWVAFPVSRGSSQPRD